MSESSRALARSWPYPRHGQFLRHVRKASKEWFILRGYSVQSKHPHVLASRDDWTKNIILPEVALYIQETIESRERAGKRFALHRSIHNGTSSQAMLFNLVGPLIVRSDFEPLSAILKHFGLEWPIPPLMVEFEYEDREVFNEDYGQPTSIDLVIRSKKAAYSLFVECKFRETEFGGCSIFGKGDCDGRNPAHKFSLCYLHHIGRRYWTLLKKYGFLDGLLAEGVSCNLATNYQFFRELLFALENGGSFILLSDARSPTFHCEGPTGNRGLIDFLSKLTPEAVKDRLISVSIQDLATEISRSGRHEWIDEFALKYGL